ncbi:iron-sulfur cluster repair di-iron protein [Aequorivita capsosiphonis]|uniref:iron-sulfur cluster repair di-iron protein n=1 Tax=Aequorivita capsosiphonis TaxID=487317 RepID=UPI0004291F46|nr:iron-sulfur cluster repair di-iron protein [Aequorivita capsosiphonis]
METTIEKNIGDLVAKDYRAAQVFKNHNIDFCCNGERPLSQVCLEHELDVQQLLNELEEATKEAGNDNTNYENWPLDLLADYIQKTHHKYVTRQSEILLPYLEKICQVHGEEHPELLEINTLFNQTAAAMATHMKEEESILFPFIKQLVNSEEEGNVLIPPSFKTVENPVAMMKDDHDAEGERFREIVRLSGNYTPPSDACNTYKVTFGLLQEFENDLHKHIHLENNILFPKAIKLEKVLLN